MCIHQVGVNLKSHGIVLGYIAVHQMFQLALAAHEIGELEAFYCSMVDRPGKWGSFPSRWAGGAMFSPLGLDALPFERLHEIPWPILSRNIQRSLGRGAQETYLSSNTMFAKSVAQRLGRHSARIFVGAETCSLEVFRAARKSGMKCVLDCPGIPSDMLEENRLLAGSELGIPVERSKSCDGMARRRHEELNLADLVFVCSDLARTALGKSGVEKSRLFVNSLWVDDCFLAIPEKFAVLNRSKPLRVLYAGRSSLAKGVPYLMDAVDSLGSSCVLTLCGGVDQEIRDWAGARMSNYTETPWVPRSKLAEFFHAHDVLVLPSLGDSFGFVALEAMACGLPVIVTTMTGVPVPIDAWKVPSHSSFAIAERLALYQADRDLLQLHGEIARAWAMEFTPANFRKRAAAMFSTLLQSDSHKTC